MKAQLIPLDGGDPITIVKDMTLVGRKEDCDLRLDHKSVSKMHCVIVKTDGLLLLRDLGSTNGTRVNGQRVRRAALLPNDQLKIARFNFRVSLGPDEPDSAEERTQCLKAEELVDLMKKVEPDDEGEDESSPDPSAPPLWANPLPDAYPEDDEEE